MTRLFVFDLDGTLVDSLRDLADTANELLTACGGAALDVEAVGRMVGEGAATLVSRAFAAAGIAKPSDALSRFLAIYDTKLLNHTRPYDGMTDVLKALSMRASLAVLTNKPLAATRRILDGLGLSTFWDPDAVLGGDGPLPRKPDPAGIRQLCARVNVGPAEAMLVGDSLVDWQTAQNAGTAVCLARYGFGFRQFPHEILNGRERIIDSPSELLTL
ncbi:MAG TPA: HAD-IA family hydrolase [Vicinamibacterales bacterium]|nr:HAD-IA family hydrolase [Vicinamibacterales bacterium]